MKYSISENVNVGDGLANGTRGKVKFIEYKIEVIAQALYG